MQYKIGFSSCPNDTFIFNALVHQKIDTHGLRFSPYIADVEALNRLGMAHQLPVTKLSFNALLHLTEPYVLLNSGSALGRNCGPLLISRQSWSRTELENKTIAIPGLLTTANFLLDFYSPGPFKKMEMVFHEIENAIISGEVDAGVIIHENRFTYQEKGLVKIKDLGAHWESETGTPIPLGGIVAKRSLGIPTVRLISKLIRESIEYAYRYPEDTIPYVRSMAQEMDTRVMEQHIELYVNKYSIDLGQEGRLAVKTLFDQALKNGQIQSYFPPFISE
jgi:1,4-dihydroxy-6-naphthoate synthase